MTSRKALGKKIVAFEKWPSDVQLAFEKYYALDGTNRSHDATAALSGASLANVRRWSSRYGWAHEVERRERALAAEERNKTLERRRNILKAAETGVGALITRYAAAAQNKCPVCMGKGMVNLVVRVARGEKPVHGDELCPSCSGSGFYNAMNLNMLAFDRAITRYGVMAGDLSDGDDNPRGPITHDEWAENQRAMLELAGAKVAKQLNALPEPDPDEVSQ